MALRHQAPAKAQAGHAWIESTRIYAVVAGGEGGAFGVGL